MKSALFVLVIASIIIGLISSSFGLIVLILVLLLTSISLKIYIHRYFSGENFNATKSQIKDYVHDCNELNVHIESLRDTALVVTKREYGVAEYADNSNWNMSRPELRNLRSSPNIHHCSRTVCDNARKEPFKYICKYFGVSATEENLVKFETILNNFEAAEDGKQALQAERTKILKSIESNVPTIIRFLCQDRLEKELGFDPVDLNAIFFPEYVFHYVSAGGNASTKCSVTMNIQNLNDFVLYLSEKIKFRKSVAGQRALMTSRLRNQIKQRDNYTCCNCGISLKNEPHLLLEIDHIVPISKGGLTTEDNLQTLCWKCNRSKGAKT